MWSADELIVAPGTADGSGARSIVRIAGDGLASLLASLFEPFDAGGHAAAASPPRVVSTHLGGLLAADWGPLPVEVLHWPGPGGPIGGPLAEVHLPCSAPLVDALIAAARRHGARVARGGEFTLRAFLAGRLDLVQAEAVLAVVEAGTPAQLSAALDRLAVSRTDASLMSIGRLTPARTSTLPPFMTEMARLEGVPPNMSVSSTTPSPLSAL